MELGHLVAEEIVNTHTHRQTDRQIPDIIYIDRLRLMERAQTLTVMPSTKNQNFENSFFVCHSVYVKVLIAQFSWS